MRYLQPQADIVRVLQNMLITRVLIALDETRVPSRELYELQNEVIFQYRYESVV